MGLAFVRQMIFTLFFAQVVLILGMPTLGYGSEEYRIWLVPIPVITILQTMRSRELLQIALKRPMYVDNVAKPKRTSKKHEWASFARNMSKKHTKAIWVWTNTNQSRNF